MIYREEEKILIGKKQSEWQNKGVRIKVLQLVSGDLVAVKRNTRSGAFINPYILFTVFPINDMQCVSSK